MSRFMKDDVGEKAGHARRRKQQVQKLGVVKVLVLIPLPFSLSPFPPPPQYMPLRAWLYRDGFARFSNTRFTLNSIDDQCILASHPPPLSVLHIPCSACPLAGPEITHSLHRCLLSARLWSGHRRYSSEQDSPGHFPSGAYNLVEMGDPPVI